LKKKEKKIDVWGHVRLIIKPVLASAAGFIIWNLLKNWGIYIGDENILTDAMFGGVFGLHSLISGFIIAWGLKRMDRVNDLNENDPDYETKYKKNTDARIPGIIHLLLASISVCILLGVVLYPYKSVGTALYVIIFVFFLITLYWEVAIELNDPIKGVWKVKKMVR
jgi:hypothetical protein